MHSACGQGFQRQLSTLPTCNLTHQHTRAFALGQSNRHLSRKVSLPFPHDLISLSLPCAHECVLLQALRKGHNTVRTSKRLIQMQSAPVRFLTCTANIFQCLKQLFSKQLCERRQLRRSKQLTVPQPAYAKKIPALRRACVLSSKQLSDVHRMTSAKLFQSWTANSFMRTHGSGQEAAEVSLESCR